MKEDEPPEPAVPGLATPPELDPLELAVARSRIGNKLFAAHEAVKLGRYHLIEVVGTGGMGVVWGAWDPELERRVAIKLVKTAAGKRRDRILREGQALAKLSHPNVVPVYDVGVIDEQVYIVMEWVRGVSLRTYCSKPRSVPAILGVYRAAGEGLAAAHDAGLVHCDFKPDNAIVGDDGRVRVLDFGLALAADIMADDIGGTPGYMAPEQASGGAVTPASDQYTFCVALREALVQRERDGGRADVPRWIDDALVRGTAAEPTRRFGSIRDLLDALARDPAVRWRRRGLLGAAAIAAIGAFAIGTLRSSDRNVACSGSEAEIATSWNPATRAAMSAHLTALGAYGADEARALEPDMTDYGRRWATAHRAACLASERGELTPNLYERTLGCLLRARVAYGTVIDVLTKTPATRLDKAIVAARGLPLIERCAIDASASTVALPPAGVTDDARRVASAIERARVLAQASEPEAANLASVAAGEAMKLGYQPLVARAHLVHGLTLVGGEDSAAAIPVLDRAAMTALDVGDDAVFVEAFAREVYAITVASPARRPPGADAALGAIPYVERVAGRLGATGGFAHALLLNNVGTSRLAAGDSTGARAYFDRSLDVPDVDRDRDVELLSALANRALVAETPAKRDALFGQTREALTRLLGAHHHRTLELRLQAAFFVVDPDQAAAQIGEVCELLRRYHRTTATSTIDHCSFELGWLAEARGDVTAARAAFADIASGDSPVSAIADAYRLLLDGRVVEAATVARAAGGRFATTAPFEAADAYLLAALCFARLHRPTDTIASARAAIALFDGLAYLADTADYQRHVARARALLSSDSR